MRKKVKRNQLWSRLSFVPGVQRSCAREEKQRDSNKDRLRAKQQRQLEGFIRQSTSDQSTFSTNLGLFSSYGRAIRNTAPSMTARAFRDLVIGNLLPFAWKPNLQLLHAQHFVDYVIRDQDQQSFHAPFFRTKPPAKTVDPVSPSPEGMSRW